MLKYTLIFVCLFCSAAIAQTPIAYYNFDNSVNDISGNNNNGAIRGDVIPVRDRFNKPCSAMHFDGISSFVEIPNSPSLESINKKFTFTVWYKFDNYYNNQWLTVFCKGKSATETKSNPQYRFQIQQSPFSTSTSCGKNIAIQSGFSSISFNTDFTKCDLNFRDHPFNINQWCFYALTYDGTTVSAFMNGNKVYSFDYAGDILPNKESLFIGLDEPGSTEFFEGSLDDLRIFDKGLSDNEILNFYTESRPLNDVNELAFQSNLKFNLAENECKKRVNYTLPNISDDCNSIKVHLLEGNPSGSLFPVGNHKISYEVVENGGSVQRNTFSVSVVDLIPPTFIFKPSDTTIYFEDPQTSVVYNYKEPIATDNCEIKKISRIAGSAGSSAFKEGTNEIVYEATDNSSNTARTSFKVTVVKKAIQPVAQNKTPTQTVVQTPVLQKIDTIKVYDKKTINDTVKTKITVRDTVKVYDKKTINDTIKTNITIRDTVKVYDKKIVNDTIKTNVFIRDTIKVYDKKVIYDTVKVINKQTVTDTIKIKTKQIVRDTIRVFDKTTIYDTVKVKVKVYDTIRPVLKSIEPKLQKSGDTLAGRKNIVQNVINISTKKLIISVYDDAIVDGDTVSVFYNGSVKVDRKMITDHPLDIEIELEENQDNILVMYAHNLGSIPPNTGLLIFYDGRKRYEVGFKSSTDANAKIIFRYAKNP